MSGVNKVILVGNLGKDPETRYMPNGKAVTNFSVATSESWTDRQSGDKQERTEWHNVVMFERLAEVAAEYLRKGSQVYIEGKLQTRKWQDKEGKDRYTTEIVAREMQMLGGRSQQRTEPSPSSGSPDETKGFDDDIPFGFAFTTPLAGVIASLLLVGSMVVSHAA